MRVVLDTNVLVSGLAYPAGSPGRIVAAWRAGAIELIVSDFGLAELARVLPALASRTGWGPADVRDFIDLMHAFATVVDLSAASLHQAQASGLRDADDSPILATLIASGASYLVTGDKDLLALATAYPIVSPAQFCALHSP